MQRFVSPLAPGKIAEKLVVSAVLLDDVNHVFKDRWLADVVGNGDGFFAGLRALPGAESFGDAGVGQRVCGVVGELVVRWDGDATDDALRPVYVPFVAVAAIESGSESLHVRDVEPLVVDGDRAGKPGGGNEAGDDAGGARLATESDDGDGVVPAIGDVESAPIAAQGEGVRLAAKRQRRIRANRDGVGDAQRFRVDHADRVGVGIGDVQRASIRA